MGSNKNSSCDFFVCAFSLIAVSAFFFLHPVGTSDLFWQMKAGEILWTSREFLRSDPFSFTFAGRPWVNFEWLSEIIFYLVWLVRGFTALSILSFVLGLGISAALFGACFRLSRSLYFSLLLVFAVFAIGSDRFAQLRPELFGFFFFALTFYLLILTENGRRWFCLPVIAAWANIHPSALAGAALVAIYIIAEAMRRRARPSDIALAAACLAMPLANPLGPAIYSLLFGVLSQNYAMTVTSDWTAPSWFSGDISFSAWGLVFFVSVSIAALVARRRVNFSILAAAIVFTIPAFFVSRFIPFSIIAWAFALASALYGMACPRALRIAVLAVCLGIPIFFSRTGPVHGARVTSEGIDLVFGPQVGLGMGEADFPVEAVNFLEAINYRGRIFNDMAWGGYLIWRMYPAQKVFIDTRTHLYGDNFIKEYADSLFDEDAFIRTVEKYNIGCVIYDARQVSSPNGPLKFLFGDKNWKNIFRTDNAVVFFKSD